MAQFFKDLSSRLTQWNVILGLILLFTGFFITIFAPRIAEKISKKIDNEEKRRESEGVVKLVFQLSGLALTIAGFIFSMVLPF